MNQCEQIITLHIHNLVGYHGIYLWLITVDLQNKSLVICLCAQKFFGKMHVIEAYIIMQCFVQCSPRMGNNVKV